MRRRLTALLAALLLTGAAAGPALAATPRVSFTDAQQQFMCTVCHEPLNEARSSEAYQENAQIRQLIAQGDTMKQIKSQMVVQYGVAVLAVPPAHGFSLLVFVIPGVVIVLGVGGLLYLIARWRRRADEAGAVAAAGPRGLSDDDARRLDAELARDR